MCATVQKCGQESLGQKNCKRLAVAHLLENTLVMQEFSMLFPLLMRYIGLNLHNACKGPKSSLQNCHPFHIIPLGPKDLVCLLLSWLPLEKKGKRGSVSNKFLIRKSVGNHLQFPKSKA